MHDNYMIIAFQFYMIASQMFNNLDSNLVDKYNDISMIYPSILRYLNEGIIW